MKKLLILATFSAFSFMAQSQDGPSIRGFKIGAGANLAIPLSNLNSTSIGAGFDLLAQYGIAEQLAITADAGYTSLFGKDGFNNLSIIPIRGGLRFFATPELYLGGKIGVGIIKTEGSESRTATAYSFGAGYFLSPMIDVSAAYDGYSKNGSFGLMNIRLGYTFGN